MGWDRERAKGRRWAIKASGVGGRKAAGVGGGGLRGWAGVGAEVRSAKSEEGPYVPIHPIPSFPHRTPPSLMGGSLMGRGGGGMG